MPRTTQLILPLAAAGLLAGCMTDAADNSTPGTSQQQISGTANDPWAAGVPTFITVNNTVLFVVDSCTPPGPLSVITTPSPTTNGNFEEIAIPKARWPVLQRMPAQDQRWSYTGQTYTYQDPDGSPRDGYCRSSYFRGTMHMLRKAWVWTQTFDIYNRNINLDTWYSIVDAWGDAGEDIAEDYLTSTDVLVDSKLIKDTGKIVDTVDFALTKVEEPEDALGVLDIAETTVDGLELCSDAVKKSGAADHLKMVKLGVMTWGLTIDATTQLGQRLGLIPESEFYNGDRDYFFAMSFDLAEKETWEGELVYFGEELPCDAERTLDFADLKRKLSEQTEPRGD